MEDIIDRWEKVGILEGIEEIDKLALANYLETMLKFYVNDPKDLDKIDEEICIWIFPLIRRVYSYIKIIDVFDLKSKFEDYVKNGKMKEHAHQFAHFQGIDIECECLGLFCEKYVKEFLDSSKPLS